jgi:hypothetical protein
MAYACAKALAILRISSSSKLKTRSVPRDDSRSHDAMIVITLNGICLEYDFRALILTGAGAAEVAARSKWSISAQGAIDLHFGVALFDRPFIFTPTRVITERQQTIEGEAVFDWLVEGCYRMPRSEVFGRDVRGKDAQVFARDIDVEESPIAVFGHGTWIVAVVEIDPASGAEVHVLDRPEWLAQLERPDRFGRALKGYRAGSKVNLEKLL